MRGLPPNATSREIANVVNELVRGNTGDIELSTGTSTTLQDHRIGPRSRIFLQARDSVGVYVSAISERQATISHDAGAAARMVDYVIIG